MLGSSEAGSDLLVQVNEAADRMLVRSNAEPFRPSAERFPAGALPGTAGAERFPAAFHLPTGVHLELSRKCPSHHRILP